MSEFSLNKEVLAALENCKDAKEIITLAKTRGITLSDEQANKIFNATHDEALTDEEMDMMVGGGDGKKDEDECDMHQTEWCPQLINGYCNGLQTE